LIVSARFLFVAKFAASESGVVSWLPDAAHAATARQAITLPLGGWVAAALDLVAREESVDGLFCFEEPHAPSVSKTPTASIASIMVNFPLCFILVAPLLTSFIAC
jgi:hypothetical protein